MKTKMKTYTVTLTLIEASTATIEVEARNLAEARKRASVIYPEHQDLNWQYEQSNVEVDDDDDE